MPEPVFFALVFLVGIATGFFDSVLNAGGFVSIPSLVFLGLPPHVAIATDRFGALGRSSAAFLRYRKEKHILWRYVPILAAISLVASLAGAGLLVSVGSALPKWAVGVFLLAVLPFLFLKKGIGTIHLEHSRLRKALGLAVAFVIIVFGSFFGQGVGILVFYALTLFLGFTLIEVLATTTLPGFVYCIASVSVFALGGIINYPTGIILLIGMASGGYIGAHTAIKTGNKWLKRLFAAFALAAGLALILL